MLSAVCICCIHVLSTYFVQDALKLAFAMISNSCSMQQLFHWQGSLQRSEAK